MTGECEGLVSMVRLRANTSRSLFGYQHKGIKMDVKKRLIVDLEDLHEVAGAGAEIAVASSGTTVEPIKSTGTVMCMRPWVTPADQDEFVTGE